MTKARLAPNLPQVCHGVRANSVALGKSLASAPGRGLRARSPCPIATHGHQRLIWTEEAIANS